MTLPERLIAIRKHLSLSQRKMADNLDSSLGALQAYESGKSVPGGNVLEQLARMGFDANWILTGEGEMIRGEGGYYFEGFSFESRLFIDVVQAGLETKGIKLPESRKQAALAYDLYRMIANLRKDLLPEVDEIKGMFQAFSVLYEKMVDGESKFSESDLPKIIEQMVKSRSFRTPSVSQTITNGSNNNQISGNNNTVGKR
jgi:transcriptional regulator with XRE-family HTH domain